MPRLRQVIESQALRGAGTPDDPCRTVTQYHDVEGKLLAESDPCRGFASCRCPAGPGENCPLTTEECAQRAR